MKIKICGMREPANILSVAALAPDYMGFIFYGKSPRFVGDTFRVPTAFPESVKRVGVFVNETIESIRTLATIHHLPFVQLHGNEAPEQCAALQEAGLKVIKVFSVGEGFDWETTTPYKTVSDFFLFDTKGKHYGGNAVTFDWKILKRYDQEIPFFLSGGLTPANIKDVATLKGMNLHALDVNSGVEDAPGKKGIVKVKALFKEVELLAF
ncbi:phosphoribosylanthranilate isomerase [Chryseolinea sp. Jin1]|uniref:N-(5'-phosphoribosyl)anthranilate isomerase n=1 Tax=Chryseolinea lacunae TaxID=2801331 RepID=A0ABS1KVK7_9BACT|nr:phosphoribosylanthranilate isomerase [Chryseolinea lacunae]